MTILIFGRNIYGRGATLDEAKKNYRSIGGRLNTQHTVVTFPPEATDIEVDMLGQVTWNGPEPTVEMKFVGRK
jgi:hypothetical protein